MQRTIEGANAELKQLQDLQQQQSTSASAASIERIQELERSLAQALQETESMRATASVNESLGSISAEDGDKPISEQLTERVDEIRAGLESKHSERVAQLEENYNKRAEGMKKQLSSKLLEGREKARQSVAAENEQALRELKSAHQQELETLRAQHQSELAKLKQSEESRFSQFKEAWISEHPASGGNISSIKSEDQAAKAMGEISEADAKTLLETNAFVRRVFQTNVGKKLNEAKEAVSLQLKEEHAKDLADKLAEAQSKANTAKEHAVSMEQKRNQIKVSMSDNKAKVAQAKLGVVQTAATETPQKPVVEVWEIAKNTKPEVAAAPRPATISVTSGQQPASASAVGQPAAPQTSQSQGQKPTPTSFGQPSASGPVLQAHSPKSLTSSFGQPSSFAQGTQVQGQKPSPFGQSSGSSQPTSFGKPSQVFHNTQTQGQKPAQAPSFGQPSLARNYPPQSPNNQPGAQQSTAQQTQNVIAQGPAQQRPSVQSPNRTDSSQPATNQANDTASALQQELKPVNGTQQPTRQPPSQPSGNIPQKPQGGNNPFAQASGPAAPRGLQQSGLPVAARGGGNRGGGNQRGRGRGRGGHQSVDTHQAQAQQQGRASPTSAGMNPGAKQFVPGNKRPRDDGQEGHHSDGAGNGKRIRGDGSGGGGGGS